MRSARASSGTTTLGFEPDPDKTFNRGYTTYFLHGRGVADAWSCADDGEFEDVEPVLVIQREQRLEHAEQGVPAEHEADHRI